MYLKFNIAADYSAHIYKLYNDSDSYVKSFVIPIAIFNSEENIEKERLAREKMKEYLEYIGHDFGSIDVKFNI